MKTKLMNLFDLMVLLMASDAGSYITGVRYAVDGGWSTMGDTMR